LQRALGLILTLAAVAAFAACGGDDSDSGSQPSPGASLPANATPFPDDQAYFEAMAVVFDDTHTEAEAIRADLQAGFTSASEDERRSAVRTYAAAYVAYADATHARIDGVTPPDSAATQHAALRDAATGVQDLGQAISTAVETSAPADESSFNTIYFDADGPALEQRFRDACRDLEALASARGVEVDYECTR
jgi:hypothetical protein